MLSDQEESDARRLPRMDGLTTMTKRTNLVELVRRASDIETVANRYARLRRSGPHSVCSCPCDADSTTASLVLDVDEQTCRCCSCLAEGDVFWLVMQHENVDFETALDILAEAAQRKSPLPSSIRPWRRPEPTCGDTDSFLTQA